MCETFLWIEDFYSPIQCSFRVGNEDFLVNVFLFHSFDVHLFVVCLRLIHFSRYDYLVKLIYHGTSILLLFNSVPIIETLWHSGHLFDLLLILF